uniref:Uncharacterized protein n=1 Tax=Arundo donax TaxID=35708 RepID=A0A0A9G2U9_ARUDO
MTSSSASTRPRSKGTQRWCTERPGGRRRPFMAPRACAAPYAWSTTATATRSVSGCCRNAATCSTRRLPVAPAPPHVPVCRGQAVSNDDAVTMTIGTDQVLVCFLFFLFRAAIPPQAHDAENFCQPAADSSVCRLVLLKFRLMP